MTPDEAIQDALTKNPDCTYGNWRNGMNWMLQMTIVVELWRNEECAAAGDPPKYVVEGYSR